MTSSKAPWLEPYPRRFVAKELRITSWDDIEPYYDQLESRPIESPADMEKWLSDWSELKSVADEFVTRRYTDMTCHTDDEDKKEAFLYCVRQFEPKSAERENVLNQRFSQSPFRADLARGKHTQLDRKIQVSIELFTPKNIPVRVKLSELSQKYQQIMGAMTVTFDGEEKTMPQMAAYLREPDPDLRKRAFLKSTSRRLEDADRVEELFDSMLTHRATFAENLNLDNYRDYCFKSKLRDYTPEDCLQFHEAIEQSALPLARLIFENRKKEMDLTRLAPWDTECDEKGRPPLKPFTSADELVDGVAQVFMSVDKRLGERFESIRFSMDLDSRKGKAPGGYQATLEEARIPFIFTNAVGSHGDVNTLLHEGGHAFHTLQSRSQPLIWDRHCAMEFSEVASMTQELLGGRRLEPFYKSQQDRDRARLDHLKGVVGLFGWVAQVDAFQHWIYTNPGNDPASRASAWLELSGRFGYGVDWSEAPPKAQQTQWHKQLHIFEVPFYYIEYAIAQLGALQIYRNYQRDADKAMEKYLDALALGGSGNVRELFEAAGIRFDFSAKLLGELMDMIKEELGL